MDIVAGVTVAQRAAEAAMATVIEYLATTKEPTSENAHEIIDKVLARHHCVSPKGHIVASGPQLAEPHEAGSGIIPRHVPVVIDIFPQSTVTGCFGDITRTVCLGKPSSELVRMYETVRSAQALAISVALPGREARAVQQAVDDYFLSQGYETTGTGTEFTFAEGFVHGVGHGLGAELHGAPKITRRTTDMLSIGDVVTIEPGLYYRHIGGVRLEDVVLVAEGNPQVLTEFPKELQICA
jgi:Xaa-Pro aminopeptidase